MRGRDSIISRKIDHKERLYYIDNFSGLFILMVVLGHGLCLSGYAEVGLYLYVLPFFFFKSGFLSKRRNFKNTLVRGG